MSGGTDLSEGRREEEPSEGARSPAPHQEEGPRPPDLPTGQEVKSLGAVKRRQREERGSDGQHKRASAMWQPPLLGPGPRQEMMSPGGKTHRHRLNAQITCVGQTKTHERPAVSPVRRERVPVRRGHLYETKPPGFYFVEGTNGADMLNRYFESKGWVKIHDKSREDFTLKWCSIRSRSNYRSFRQGEQLIFQIPNNNLLTTKIGLLCSLREYERVCSKIRHSPGNIRQLKMQDFIPTTFRLDLIEEREAFFSLFEDVQPNQSVLWICKPSGMNQGRGIFLLKSLEDVSLFRQKLLEAQSVSRARRQPKVHVVQRYILNPLLLEGKKFDVRSFLMIACTSPYMVFFRHGYVRLTCNLYDPNTNDMSTHLTNQAIQKTNPLYSELKEDTVWSMEALNAYVNDKFAVAKGLPRDWVMYALTNRMQQIMTQCFLSVKAKLDCRLGFFDLIGCDFMIDEDFHVWLLEMNCNPALHTNCSVLQEVIPNVIHETLDLTLEIFNKCRHGKSILPLSSQRDFVLLFNKVFQPTIVLPCDKSRGPTGRTRRKSRANGSQTRTLN